MGEAHIVAHSPSRIVTAVRGEDGRWRLFSLDMAAPRPAENRLSVPSLEDYPCLTDARAAVAWGSVEWAK